MRTVRIFLCGDVMTGRGIDQILAHPSDPALYESWLISARGYVELAERANGPVPRPVDDAYVWGEALEVWRRRAPDARLMNLETSVTTSDRHQPKGINYRMHPANVACLAAAAPDCCGLANNHVLDWGRSGLVETLETLHGAGLRTAGAGLDLETARAPAVIPLAGGGRLLVFAVASVCSGVPADWAAGTRRPGVRLVDLSVAEAQRLAAEIHGVRRPGDLAIVSVHWGGNWGHEVPADQRAFAHALIDAGAVALVHGHSAHHAKAAEVRHGRLILYGAGDFLNDYEGISGYEAFLPDLATMWFADLDADSGALVRLWIEPLRIRRFRLERAAPEEIEGLRVVLSDASSAFGADLTPAPDGGLELRWDEGGGTRPGRLGFPQFF